MKRMRHRIAVILYKATCQSPALNVQPSTYVSWL